jgi:ATP-dependent Clp protease ATP-binding subunit ClpC
VFERFSDTAQRVLVLAEDESRRLGHEQIGTEHLLLGILAEGTSSAARALELSGATLDASRSKVEEAVGVAHRESSGGTTPFSDRTKRALERANRLSLRRRDPHVETEHILVSVLEIEGRAGQILRGLAIDPAGVRDTVDSFMEERPVPAARTEGSREPRAPRCQGCGSAVDDSLTHRVMSSPGVVGEVRHLLIAYCSVCGWVFGASTTEPGAGTSGAP